MSFLRGDASDKGADGARSTVELRIRGGDGWVGVDLEGILDDFLGEGDVVYPLDLTPVGSVVEDFRANNLGPAVPLSETEVLKDLV